MKTFFCFVGQFQLLFSAKQYLHNQNIRRTMPCNQASTVIVLALSTYTSYIEYRLGRIPIPFFIYITTSPHRHVPETLPRALLKV
jgi:hypothetical protein